MEAKELIKKTARLAHGIQVGRVGLEPTRYLYRRILSPLRLPNSATAPQEYILLDLSDRSRNY